MGCGCRGNRKQVQQSVPANVEKNCHKCKIKMSKKRVISRDLNGYVYIFKCTQCGLVVS